MVIPLVCLWRCAKGRSGTVLLDNLMQKCMHLAGGGCCIVRHLDLCFRYTVLFEQGNSPGKDLLIPVKIEWSRKKSTRLESVILDIRVKD